MLIDKLLEFCEDLNRCEKDSKEKEAVMKKCRGFYYDCIFDDDGSIREGYYFYKDIEGVWRLCKKRETVKEDV